MNKTRGSMVHPFLFFFFFLVLLTNFVECGTGWNMWWDHLQSDKMEGKLFGSFYHGRVIFHYCIRVKNEERRWIRRISSISPIHKNNCIDVNLWSSTNRVWSLMNFPSYREQFFRIFCNNTFSDKIQDKLFWSLTLFPPFELISIDFRSMDYSYENNFEETKIDFDIELITKKKKKKRNYIEITIPLKREQIWYDAIIQMSWIILNTSMPRVR